jgi:pyridinium-3,5-biscarboxylic acid mononucleotide synthase
MNRKQIETLLIGVRNGVLDIDTAVNQLKELPFKDLGFAKVDNHREIRTGYPEVIFGQGKTPIQVREIIKVLISKGNNILATKVTPEIYDEVKKISNDTVFHEAARCITIRMREPVYPDTTIAVVTAGTSDLPVAEEAVVTAEILDNRVNKIVDVGVAGIHRLFNKIDEIRKARVVIVIAGMEGALPSVVGGLVDKPVIAVPTSVGYGANFGGISALLGMLTSCASGISVVNIDNGFGAAYLASIINKL